MKPVTPPSRETLGKLAAILLGLVVLAALSLLGGCAAQRVTCPLGTYPGDADSELTSAGGGDAGVTVPAGSGQGSGKWQTAGKSSWKCSRLCPKGTALDYSTSDKGTRVRCVPIQRPVTGASPDKK